MEIIVGGLPQKRCWPIAVMKSFTKPGLSLAKTTPRWVSDV